MKLVSQLRWIRTLAIIFASLACALTQAAPLKFWAVTGSVSDVAMYRQLADQFKSKSGIEVEVTPLAWGNFATKYFTAMAAGIPPDIGVTNLGGPFAYGSVGGLVDFRTAFPEECAALEKRLDPKLLPLFSIGKSLYALPSDLSCLVLFYRTDLFAKMGLTPPKTWSELEKTLATLEGNGYKYFFGFTNGAQFGLSQYAMPYGLQGITRDAQGKPVVQWNDPKYIDAMMWAMRFWNLHDSPGKDLGARAVGMFRSNDPDTALPLIIDLPSLAQQLPESAPELKGKWAIAPWPKADDGEAYNLMGGTAYVIFRKSARQKDSFAWMNFLNSPEAQRFMIRNRLNRGDESALTISPLKEMWAPENDEFWRDPKLRADPMLVSALKQIVPTFHTVESMQGLPDATRLEGNLLDRMVSFCRDLLDKTAKEHGMSRTQLFKEMGAGRLPGVREGIEKQVRAELVSEYAKITPQALKIVQDAEASYAAEYGDVTANLAKYESQRTVLDLIKALVLIGFLGLTAGLVASPRTRKHLVSYAFVGVPIFLAAFFVFVPAITALYLSFTNYHPVLPLSTARWIGFENFLTVLKGDELVPSLLRTLTYAAVTLPVGIVLALVFAYLLNSKLRAERLWRFLYFSPLVTSIVSISLIFSQLFLGGKQGWLNSFLISIGQTKDPIPFLTSEHSFLNCVIVLAIWHGLAFTILVFLAGLQQISSELYEAAEVDGAGALRRMWNIALPGLRPQIFFCTVLGLIGSFQVFETIYTLASKGSDAAARFGPNDSGLTMVPLIYHTGFETLEMGKSSAIAYILFLIILAVTMFQMRLYRRFE